MLVENYLKGVLLSILSRKRFSRKAGEKFNYLVFFARTQRSEIGFFLLPTANILFVSIKLSLGKGFCEISVFVDSSRYNIRAIKKFAYVC